MQRIAPQNQYVFLKQPDSNPARTDRRMIWEQVLLPRRLRELKPDIYHAPYGASPLPIWCGCPVVTTIHDFILPRSAPTLRLPGKIYGQYFLWAIKYSTHLITDSVFTKQEALCLTRCHPEQLTPILLGVNHALFHPMEEYALINLRERWSLPSDFILYIGSLEERKGTDTLIKIFAALSSDFPNLHLVITSQTQWEHGPYYELAKHLGVERRIKYLGFAAREDLPGLFNLAKIFLFPSRLEGFGLPVLESMACGTPVVCSNAASLPEVAGDACYLVEPEDIKGYARGVRELLQNERLHNELKSRGLKRSTLLTWDESARQTLNIFDKVYNGST